MTKKKQLRVTFISPGQSQEEQKAVAEVLEDLNRNIASDERLVFEFALRDAHPAFHNEGPEGVIDDLLRIEDSDIVIAVLSSRFGFPQPDAIGGPEHVLRIAYESWKRQKKPYVLFYFHERESEFIFTPEEALEFKKQLTSFKRTVAEDSIYREYRRLEDFRQAVNYDLAKYLSEMPNAVHWRDLGRLPTLENTEVDTQSQVDAILARLDKAVQFQKLEQANLPQRTDRGENKAKPQITIRVFYGTDRRRLESDSRITFTSDRSDSSHLNLGYCDVTIPAIHLTGRLESPKWWKLEFKSDPAKHVTLKQVTELSERDFYGLLRQCVRGSAGREAFVFIHGFNVSFEDGARRTAQIAHDLEFNGAPIMFSWPSCASIKGYMADEATIDWVLPHLRQFLQDIVDRGDVHALHLIAHSMGNRALARVLKEIAISSADLRFNQVLMAAPDIDRGEFLQIAEKMRVVSERVTLYASSSDKALQASQTLHNYPRAGEAGDNIVVDAHVDTIDASLVDTDFLAHSYFCEDRILITDIFYVVNEGKPPERRYGLDPRFSRSGTYWAFRR